jgi:hypothetical protein
VYQISGGILVVRTRGIARPFFPSATVTLAKVS